MEGVDAEGNHEFSKLSPQSQSDCGQIPKELAELEDYLDKLSSYVKKYSDTSEETVKEEENRSVEEENDLPSCETSFSVKEHVPDGGIQVETIVIPPPEPITIISPPEKKDLLVASTASEIGLYFIHDVVPVNFINVIQRELLTLAGLFPSVASIVQEINKEFHHFKVCRSCLKNLSPLLPDVLKELQELIKFIKKKRNQSYFWPDDSDYLRKLSEELPAGEEKIPKKRKFREEAVGFVTVHRKKRNKLTKVDSSMPNEEAAANASSGCRMKRYSYRLTDSPQSFLLRSEIQSDVTLFEKLQTVEKVNEPIATTGKRSFPSEFSRAQELRFLHPASVLETVIQLEKAGIVTHSSISSGNAVAVQDKDFLPGARFALAEAFIELLRHDKMKTTQELSAHLQELLHKNQVELNKVLLEKDVPNSNLVQVAGSKVVYEEGEGALTNGGRTFEKPAVEDLQRLVEDLKGRCNAKNRMIIALLNGLRSNVPKRHWEELIRYVLHEAGTENFEDYFKKSSPPEPEHHQVTTQAYLTIAEQNQTSVIKFYFILQFIRRSQEWKTRTRQEFQTDEILCEREVKLTRGRSRQFGRDRARISFSEVIARTSRCLKVTELATGGTASQNRQETIRGPNSEAEEFLRDVHGETDIMANRTDGRRTMEVKKEETKIVKSESGSAMINVTIKIGDGEATSQYQSAVSVIPSEATLAGSKSETSVGDRAPNASFVPERSETKRFAASGSFARLALKFKVPMTFRHDRESGKAEVKIAAKEIVAGGGTEAQLGAGQAEIIPSRVGWFSDASLATTESRSGTSALYPEIDVYCKQNTTMRKLRSRLGFLEESLRSLTRTIDRMDVLTDKLADDAYESSQNFKDIFNRYTFMSNELRS